MIKSFIAGAVAGGVAVLLWKDKVDWLVDASTRGLRTRAADKLRLAEEKVEDALDTAKEQITSNLRAGEEAIRPAPAPERA